MTRAFLIALVVSVAASAQQAPPPLPLPGAAPALPLPGAAAPAEPKAETKKEAKARRDAAKKEAAEAKKGAAGLALPAAEAKKDPALPLPGAAEAKRDPALPLPAAAEAKKDPALPLPAAEAKKEPALPLPAAEAKKSGKKDVPALPLPEKSAEAKKEPGLALPLPEAKKEPGLSLPLPGGEKKEPAPAAAQAKPPPAAPATPPPTTGVKTLTAQQGDAKTPPAAPGAGAPLASAMMGPDSLNLRGSGTTRPLWNVRGFLGAERSSEQNYTGPASLSRVGVEGTRWFSTAFLARLAFDWRTSRQEYVPLHVSGGQRTVAVDENRFDIVGDVGYDLGPRIAPSGRFELTPLLGIHYLGIRNDAFPTDVFGVNVGARTRFYLSPAVIPHLTFTYTYNFSVPSETSQNSALKSPLSDLAIRGGLALPLAGGYALELDYQGDILSFQNTYRVAHGAALGFGSSF
jgi:hypothetical protein